MNSPKFVPVSILAVGSLLFLLGIFAYFFTGRESLTALIPSAFGVLFIILGALAVRLDKARKHLIHGAMLLALLGLAGTVSSFKPLALWILSDETPKRPMAVIVQAITCFLCFELLVYGIISFIKARRARNSSETQTPPA